MRIVTAIGGNAIIAEDQRGTWEQQLDNVRAAARALTALRHAGHELVVTHGNGPQVGALQVQHAAAAADVPALPLDTLVAMTQGQLGYLLQTAFEEADPAVRTATVLTRMRVEPDDPAFAAPTKPVGPFYSEAEAERISRARGWSVAADSGRGWRCVVPSPSPQEIVELEQIDALVERGMLVIAAGGGGVPVVRRQGRLEGVEAVIDKDRASSRLALALDADLLVMLTGVPHISLEFGTRWQRDMARLTVSDAERLLADGEFPAGSMGPKVESGVRFVRGGGRAAIVTSLERLHGAVAGSDGTAIVPDGEGPSTTAAAETAMSAAA